MTATWLAHYRRLRNAQWSAREALRAAKVRDCFEAASAAGDVRLRYVEDPEPYMFGDVEDEPATRARIEQHGVWGIIGEYVCPCCDEWRQADSCWGFVGDDLQDNGTDTDIMQAAIDAAANGRHS
jgi:hypothetical protein